MAHTWFTKEEIASWPPEHKQCRGCHEVLSFDKFHKHKQALFGYANYCKECRKPASKEQWKKEPYEVGLLRSANTRAKKLSLPFSLTLADIKIPKICPILDVPIVTERKHLYRPTIDRIVPRLGYIPENIQIVSFRGNYMKSNMNIIEAMKVTAHLSTISDQLALMGGLQSDLQRAMKPFLEEQRRLAKLMESVSTKINVETPTLVARIPEPTIHITINGEEWVDDES